MTQQEKNEWLADVWIFQAQARTQAMGVLSTPQDSVVFADEVTTEFIKRFDLAITTPSPEPQS